MSTLIHLNGPPGVGKSTLAQKYVDSHRGVLNLDIDTVVSLIGGWREDFFGVLAPARRIALAMAEAHLRDRDVVMPQLVANVEEARRFESAAHRAGANYVEVVLTAETTEQSNRFHEKASSSELNAHIEHAVAKGGGRDLLDRIEQDFVAYLDQRSPHRRLPTTGLDVDTSYEQLLAVLQVG